MSTLVTSAADDLAQSATDVNSTGRVSPVDTGLEAAFVSSEPRVGLANKNSVRH
jgi:hypothetical protein